MSPIRRAFTLWELLIVISCASITVPIAFVLIRNVEADQRAALARAEATAAMRTFSEELRTDLQIMSRTADDSLVLAGAGACARVEYALEGEVLFRSGAEPCGPRRPVASHVRSLKATRVGVELVFSHPIAAAKALETRFFLGASR